jgi:hypothetical protein
LPCSAFDFFLFPTALTILSIPLAFPSSELNFHQLSDNYAFDPSHLLLKKASNQILNRPTVVLIPFLAFSEVLH